MKTRKSKQPATQPERSYYGGAALYYLSKNFIKTMERADPL
jgi:hypothetical protein